MEGSPFYQESNSEVSEWAGKMKEYAPNALASYTKLQEEVLEDGALTRKDKLLILLGMNAAGRYERGVAEYTKQALAVGATVNEIVEIITPCILSRGIPAWFEGLQAIQLAVEESNASLNHQSNAANPRYQDVSEVVDYFIGEAGGNKADWLDVMEQQAPSALYHYGNLRTSILTDGAVPRKLKEFVLVGINVAERYPKGVELHANTARKLGATEEELSEVFLTGVLNGGIPAWFEGSPFLK